MIAGSATAAAAPEAYSIAWCVPHDGYWAWELHTEQRSSRRVEALKKAPRKKIDKSQRPEMSKSK